MQCFEHGLKFGAFVAGEEPCPYCKLIVLSAEAIKKDEFVARLNRENFGYVEENEQLRAKLAKNKDIMAGGVELLAKKGRIIGQQTERIKELERERLELRMRLQRIRDAGGEE